MNHQTRLMRDALPPAAQALFDQADGWIDPADAFIAAAEGLTSAQACSRARNSARPLGGDWPENFVWEQRVAGSNPVAPTSLINDLRAPAMGRLFRGRGLLPICCQLAALTAAGVADGQQWRH